MAIITEDIVYVMTIASKFTNNSPIETKEYFFVNTRRKAIEKKRNWGMNQKLLVISCPSNVSVWYSTASYTLKCNPWWRIKRTAVRLLTSTRLYKKSTTTSGVLDPNQSLIIK